MTRWTHDVGEDLVLLFLAILIGILAHLGVTFLALGGLELSLGQILLFLRGSQLLGLVTMESAIHFVELLETINSDDAYGVFSTLLSSSTGGHLIVSIVALRVGRLRVRVLGHRASLVLREHIRVARQLRGGALPVRLGLLQLLQRAVVQARLTTRLRVLRGYLLVETVANALAQSINSRVAASSIRLLIAHALVVIIWVVGLGIGRQLDSLALG